MELQAGASMTMPLTTTGMMMSDPAR